MESHADEWRNFKFSDYERDEFKRRWLGTNESRKKSFRKLHPEFDGLPDGAERVRLFTFWYNFELKRMPDARYL